MLNLKKTPNLAHLRLSILNGRSIKSENLPLEVEDFKESSSLNLNVDYCAVGELSIVKFEKKLFFKLKNDMFLHIRYSILNE